MISKLNNKPVTHLIHCLIIFSVAFSINSSADDHENARGLVQSGEILPLETILEKLKKRVVGRIIEVELERKKGQLIYEIEQVDDQGVVKEFIFDAKTGDLLKEEVDD